MIGYRVAGALLAFPIPEVELTGPVQVFTSVNRHRREGLLAHRHPRQPRRVVRLVDGLVVTGELRTAVDCLSAMSPDRAEDLYAWLTTRRRITHADLTKAVRLLTGKHGVASLHELQRRTVNGAVSAAERRAHDILRRAGISGWEAGAEVTDRDGRLIGVVDLLFREARVVVEIDGRRAHSDPVHFEKDRERQNRLVRAGYLVLRYTWRQLITNPGAVADDIRRTLRDRLRAV